MNEQKSKAYLEGVKVGTTHVCTKCPYADGSDKCFDWEEGWLAGDAGGHKKLTAEAQAADDRVCEEEEGQI